MIKKAFSHLENLPYAVIWNSGKDLDTKNRLNGSKITCPIFDFLKKTNMRMITESSRMYVFTVNTYEELFNKDVFISVCRPATFLGAVSQRQMWVAC